MYQTSWSDVIALDHDSQFASHPGQNNETAVFASLVASDEVYDTDICEQLQVLC
jgi:hypothetical protein